MRSRSELSHLLALARDGSPAAQHQLQTKYDDAARVLLASRKMRRNAPAWTPDNLWKALLHLNLRDTVTMPVQRRQENTLLAVR